MTEQAQRFLLVLLLQFLQLFGSKVDFGRLLTGCIETCARSAQVHRLKRLQCFGPTLSHGLLKLFAGLGPKV